MTSTPPMIQLVCLLSAESGKQEVSGCPNPSSPLYPSPFPPLLRCLIQSPHAMQLEGMNPLPSIYPQIHTTDLSGSRDVIGHVTV